MLRRAKAKYPSSKRNTATDADILGMYCVCASDCAITARGRKAGKGEGMRESICICIYEIKHKVRSGDRRLLHIWHT